MQQKQPPYHDLLQLLAEKNTTKVKLAITDMDGILRGKMISFEKFSSIVEKGFGFCNVVFGWDAADAAYDNAKYTGWHTGYPDAIAVIDINSFRLIPWEDNLPFFLADFRDNKGNDLTICPRNLLKKITNQAEVAGFTPYFSQEFEWFNLLNNTNEPNSSAFNTLQPITNGMFGYSLLRAAEKDSYFHELFDQLTKQK